jgi:hypothetical protein
MKGRLEGKERKGRKGGRKKGKEGRKEGRNARKLKGKKSPSMIFIPSCLP